MKIMDHQNLYIESERSSSSSRHSLSKSSSFPQQFDDSVESDAASEAGDIGDRALQRNNTGASGRSTHFLDNLPGNGVANPHREVPSALHGISPPRSVDAMIQSEDKKGDEKEVPWLLDYITCLLTLALFGILGVLARFSLHQLFGADILGPTSHVLSFLHRDLPSNLVGSFLMGWFGVVFKADIMKVSSKLLIGLTTGFLGSLTIFSGWNQDNLDLSVKGRWIFALLSIFIGLILVEIFITLGVKTAKGLKWLYGRSNTRSFCGINTCYRACISNKYQCLLTVMTVLLLMLVLLWTIFGIFLKNNFKTGSSEAQLFLACLVGPFGVWIRWFLARFNGRGLGKNGRFKWMPFGTLAANVLAACVTAALSLIKKAVKTKNCNTFASGIQFGFPGCLSTVSAFIAEFHAMIESKHPLRAFAYATGTFMISFVLGTLIYSTPVWVMGYD